MMFILTEDKGKKYPPSTFSSLIKTWKFSFCSRVLPPRHSKFLQCESPSLFQMLLGYLSLLDTPATKDTQSDISVHLHSAHPRLCGIPAGGGNSYYRFLWNFGSYSPGSRVVVPPQELMNHCDIWQFREDMQGRSQANGKCLPVCKSLFGELRSI